MSSLPSAAEQELAHAVIPALARGPLIAGARTALGTRALAAPAATERWHLLRVDSLVESKREAQARTWAVIWLIAEDEAGQRPHFVCPSCAAIALPALIGAAGDVEAIGEPIHLSGHEDLRPEPPMRVGKATVWPLRWHWRHKGVWEQRLRAYEVRKKRLVGEGDIPVFYSNEGRCGRIDDVGDRGRPIGRSAECKLVFRYRAALSASSRGLRASERLRTAHNRDYEIKETRADITHRFNGTRWKASRRSLRQILDDP